MTVTRAQWGAVHEDGAGSAPLPVSEVWLHHSVTLAPDLEWLDPNRDGVDDDEAAAMRTLERIGEERFGRGISYTVGVMPSGRLYQGHSWNRLGAHTGGRNTIARAYCLVGNYDARSVTDAQIDAVATDLVRAKRAGQLTAARLNGGHQEAPGARTGCPGRFGMLAVAYINARAAALEAAALTPEDTMTPQQQQAIELRLQKIENGIGALIGVAERPLDAERRLSVQLADIAQALGARLAPLGPVKVNAEEIQTAVYAALTDVLGTPGDAGGAVAAPAP